MVTDSELRQFISGAYDTFLSEFFDYIDENAALQGVSAERLHIQLRNLLTPVLVEEWRHRNGYGH